MFVCTWKIEFFRFAFHLTLKRSLWPWNYFTFLFLLQTIFGPSFKRAERERESKDRPSSNPTATDRAPVRRPTPRRSHQSRRSQHCADRTDLVDHSTAPIKQRSTPTPHDLTFVVRSRLRLRRAILPLDRTQSPLSLSSFFSQFDRIWWIFFFFFFGFCFFWVCGLRNYIIYLFGSWENVRKCEQQVENVFSIVFSRTQPNTRKYFPKHFLKCNQTLENIFLSWKYFTPNQTQPKIHICIWIVTIYIYIAIVSRILFCTILHKLM